MTVSKTDAVAHILKAQKIWDSMNDSEKFGCKFGLFPADAMDAAEVEGYDGKQLTLELMHRANQADRKQQGLT